MGNARNIAFWVVLFLLILALFNLFSGGNTAMQSREISYSEFVSSVNGGSVTNVTLDGERIRFRGSDGSDYVTIKPTDANVSDFLIEQNVAVRAEQQQQSALPLRLALPSASPGCAYQHFGRMPFGFQ